MPHSLTLHIQNAVLQHDGDTGFHGGDSLFSLPSL
jgi:hypothetical protein